MFLSNHSQRYINKNMEILIYTLIVFVLLSCTFKLSQWGWTARIVFGALLAAFVVWSEQYAVQQSKTQLADYLDNITALQNMAVVVTIDSVFCFGYAFCYFQDMYTTKQSDMAATKKNHWWLTILKWYSSLLMFPVTFYAFTQTLFVAVGVDFSTTTWAFAAACLVGLPLIAEGCKWLVPEQDGRVEMQLLSGCFVCVLGLISTESGKMVYKVQETRTDWHMIVIAVGIFAVLFGIGVLWDRRPHH